MHFRTDDPEDMTPWQLVRTRFLCAPTSPGRFAQKHGLDVERVKKIFSGEEIEFWPELCTALSVETRRTADFYKNLSDQHMSKDRRPTKHRRS